jgi:hypothetical protein
LPAAPSPEGAFILTSSSPQARSFLLSDVFCVLGVIACSLTGFAQITKYFHGAELVFFAVGIALVVVLAMLWLRWRHLKTDRELGILWLVLLWSLFALLFAVLFPISQRHILGVGSDRADALRVADSALMHSRYPYDAKTYLGNSVTPLPGAVLLSIPFYLMGNVSLQNLLWLAIFIGFSCRFFRDRSTALIYVLLLLGTSVGNLDDFVVGGDFLVNTIYVCVAVALVLATHEEKAPLWSQIASEVFLGLAVDSRPIYVVVFPLLLAYLWQRRGRNVAIRALLISGCTAALLSIPFYLYDPAHFAPLHVRHKLDFIPAKYHATFLFPALGLLGSCVGFFIRLSRQRVYLLLGISLLLMVGVPGLIEWFCAPFTLPGWYGLGLLGLPGLFFSLCIVAKYQDTGHRLRSALHLSPQSVHTPS